MQELLTACRLCPRQCGANRLAGEYGICGGDDKLKIARAALHFWEEPCLSGASTGTGTNTGSGAVFFSGCSLGCVFCQNGNISRGGFGKEITVERLADIFLELQEKGALNINLVTPTQFIPQIIEGLTLARRIGLSLPVVYNTSGYERVESLKRLEGFVDIYLPDFKYFDSRYAARYSGAPDYPQVILPALDEMLRQVGDCTFDDNGILTRGMIVRHLVLSGLTADSKEILRQLYERYGDRIFISIMNQYTPVGGLNQFPELNRKLTEAEYDEVVEYAISIGVENGFIQEGETATESFIPPFDLRGVLP